MNLYLITNLNTTKLQDKNHSYKEKLLKILLLLTE